ncbi:energy-coupling factor ABC transporter ATP-binding protein [Bifidobacterium avesanii]|uniref:ATP-binding cassette domain-containing protein n=1 Tax=Bifidobacterium avesanii TaxID=1798157 RepID=A0A7K3TH66_9BIFI|nr:energy-coupling factor ABC transporter ATP-binding protein [Bifidobacterium avesanii]KAB8295589.1 ABC transporter ATP-binding protein [Bifidobacterium avesanii]NEG77593.1 ATP-binding cassette domain-containing protein [Bifidobacterium avesanii]
MLFDFLRKGESFQNHPDAAAFELGNVGYTYEDGGVGLLRTSLNITPDDKRVAVIGLNGSGKTTLLKLLDGALVPAEGVTVTVGGETLNTASKRDLKRVEQLVGRVRREEIPNAFYQAKDIAEALTAPLKKRRVAEGERNAIVGNLLAHFNLSDSARRAASELDSEKRHLLAIAAALTFNPAAIVADEPTKGLDEVGSAHVAAALFSYDKQVVFATHDTDLIRRPEYAIGRTLVLDEHRIAFDGKPDEAVAFYEDLIRRKAEALRAR